MGERESGNDIASAGAGEPGAPRVGLLKRALAERLLEGRLPGGVAAWVHRRLRRDPAWAAWYDLQRRIERAAAGSPALTNAQADAIKRMLFAAPLEEPVEEARPAASRAGWLGVSVAAAAACLALFVALEAPRVRHEGGWTPRGAATDALGFRVRCVAADGKRVLAEAEAGTRPALGPPALSCPADGLLAFSATNLSDEPAYFFVVGVTGEGAVRWYAPFEEGEPSVSVPSGAVDHLMRSLAGLRNMRDDHVALFAVFSPSPLRRDEVRRGVEAARREGLTLPALSRLPLSSSAQARIDLYRQEEAP